MTPTACPLCCSPAAWPFHADARRRYMRCPGCHLVFVPAAGHLLPAGEKAEYDLHRNDLADPGYRAFLERIAVPVRARVSPGSTGLDVGCGPAPLLAAMLGEAGISMRVYDPFYAPDETVWAQRYDVVTASEVVEHFRTPARDFDRLFAAVKPGGLLAVMTKRVRDPAAFARWHYIQDPTHVAFFSEETFAWIATHYGAALEVIGADVVTFRTCAGDNAPIMSRNSP